MLNQIEKRRQVGYKPIKANKKTSSVLVNSIFTEATIKAFSSIVTAPDIESVDEEELVVIEEEKPVKKQGKKKKEETVNEDTVEEIPIPETEEISE